MLFTVLLQPENLSVVLADVPTHGSPLSLVVELLVSVSALVDSEIAPAITSQSIATHPEIP